MQLGNPLVSFIVDMFVGEEIEKQRLHASRSLKAIMRLAENNRNRLNKDDIANIVEFFNVHPLAPLSFEVHKLQQDGNDVKSAIKEAIGKFIKNT